MYRIDYDQGETTYRIDYDQGENTYMIDYDQGETTFSWQKTSVTFHEYNQFGTFIFE